MCISAATLSQLCTTLTLGFRPECDVTLMVFSQFKVLLVLAEHRHASSLLRVQIVTLTYFFFWQTAEDVFVFILPCSFCVEKSWYVFHLYQGYSVLAEEGKVR